MVKSYPRKSIFSGDHILAPRGYCAPKFLHVLENDQVLLMHTPWGIGIPLTIFLKGVQNWLKISILDVRTFEPG